MYRYTTGKLISCLQHNTVNGKNDLFSIDMEDGMRIWTTYRGKWNDARELEDKQVKVRYNINGKKNWLNAIELAKDKP